MCGRTGQSLDLQHRASALDVLMSTGDWEECPSADWCSPNNVIVFVLKVPGNSLKLQQHT